MSSVSAPETVGADLAARDTAPAADAASDALAALRGEIDRIDDALHDLLMQRAAVVGEVGMLARQGKVAFRPGREAAVIRRLLARHAGPLPRRSITRLWREIYAAHIAIQTSFTVAVCDAEGTGSFVAAAREHFGALTPLRAHRSPAQAIGEVRAGSATVAVLPLPVEEEPAAAAWWVALLHREEPRIRVVARLPFWGNPRPDGAPGVQSLVVAAAAPDASGQDRSLLGFEVSAQASRARLAAGLADAGLHALDILLRRTPRSEDAHGLVELDGLLAEDDPRLAALAQVVQRPVVLGGYAVPLDATGA